MADIAIAGCAPTPLASYLKALGVARLVAEQADPEARVWWQDERLLLRSVLNEDSLAGFLLDDYVPTPILAPWNGGSGFYAKDAREGIDGISASQTSRFALYRDVISICRTALREQELTSSPKDESKSKLLSHLRANLPEDALPGIDAAVVLTAEGELRYPPLVGTGWNDGRLEFSNNFMQRLVQLIDPQTGESSPQARAWLVGSLFGEPTPFLASKAVGQFDPGGAGGPNATTGFESDSLVNPWDFVLMIEGALVFAGAATRRLSGPARARLSYPFTVKVTGRGAANIALDDEPEARGEMWLPLWRRPASLREIRAIFSEGRLTLGGRLARDGLDVARAIAALGVDRGIAAFQRYGLFMRSGRAFLAVPTVRMPVKRNTAADLIADLDRDTWLDRIRRKARDKNASGRFRMLGRALDDALFEVTQRGDPRAVQNALLAVAAMERYVGFSPKVQEDVPPLRTLGEDWLHRAEDGTPEFRIAAAIASLNAPGWPIRTYIYPVAATVRTETFEWSPGNNTCVWRRGNLLSSMSAVLSSRFFEATSDADPSIARTAKILRDPMAANRGAGLAAVTDFLLERIDDRRVEELLTGLVLVLAPKREQSDSDQPPFLPSAYLILKLLFVPTKALWAMNVLPDGASLPLPPELLRDLESNRAAKALATAERRLRASGVRLTHRDASAAGLNSLRLAAALLIPIDWGDTRRLCDRVCFTKQETQGATV